MTPSEAETLLVQINLAIAAGVALVVLLRLPARRWFGARAAYRVWLLPPAAIAAMLVPARSVMVDAHGSVVGPAEFTLGAAGSSLALNAEAAVLAAWGVGVLAFALHLALLQKRFLREARLGEAGPAVIGVLRPRLVLPADFEQRFDAGERAAIVAHEQAHIAAQHPRINAVLATAQIVFWFNPMAHLASHLSRLDQELACDATVVGRMPALRQVYAQTLLKTQLAATPLPLGCYWPARAQHPLMERIAMLARPKPTRTTRLAAAAMITVATAAVGLGAWAARPPQAVVAPVSTTATAQPVSAAAIDGRTAAIPAAVTPSKTIAPREAAASPTPQTLQLAQAQTRVSMPDWLSRPTGEDLVRFYPAEALKASLSGMARLECDVAVDGHLTDCSVADEAPAEAGFGEAAMQLAPYFQMKPLSRDGQPVAGGKVVIPIRFALN